MINLGMVAPGSTILVPFHTFDSNDPSASVTITGLALADVGIYKGTSMTERASTTGVVLLDTDGIDIDTTTGIHGLSIDLSSNATADFYTAGSHYYVTIASITVDGATVNFVAATFSIGYPGAVVNTTIATLASQTSFTLTAASADNDAYNGSIVIVHGVASAVQVAQGAVSDYTGASKTITLGQDPGIFTMAAGDNVSVFPAHALAFWDRVLTGATHNIATSAGRRLRNLQDFGLYENGAVWIDTVNGTAGTTDFENGTVTNPVDSIADAKTIADSIGLRRFQIVAGSSITLAATFDNYAFFSDDGWTLALGGQSIDDSSIVGADVSGTFTGTPHFAVCVIGAITGPSARIGHCGLDGTITANAAGDWVIHHCWSEIAGATTPIFDFGTDAAVSNNVTFGHYANGIEIRNFNNSGTDLLSLSGIGQVIYAASSSGTVNQRGDWRVTNTGGVTITADDNTRLLAGTVPQKNAALSNIEFLMVDATDFTTPETGLTVAGTRSIDGGAFGAVSGAIAEVANGIYQFDAAAADMNGDIITFRFTSAGAADRFVTIRTSG